MLKYVVLCVFAVILTSAYAAPPKDCDKSKCKGPLKFYEELSCTPVYKNEGDCCAYKYNCDHLKARSKDKCYIRGHEYKKGESLREEDSEPCQRGCSCRETNGVAGFECGTVDCFDFPYQPGCYRPRNVKDCCPGSPVCPEKPEDWPTCRVDGKIYNASEYFSPAAEPEKDCYCGAGYKGENIEPFCRIRSPSKCGIEVRHAYEIYNNYPPVFSSADSPQTDCPVEFRHQNDKDRVLKPEGTAVSREVEAASEEMMCKFGNLRMRLGEELNQKTYYDSVCVKCVCETPPVPTCKKLPRDICDVTDLPDFRNH